MLAVLERPGQRKVISLVSLESNQKGSGVQPREKPRPSGAWTATLGSNVNALAGPSARRIIVPLSGSLYGLVDVRQGDLPLY